MTLGYADRQVLLRLHCGRCAWCGEPLPRDFSVDHIVPRSRGGLTEPWNVAPMHYTCNTAKGDSDPDPRLVALARALAACVRRAHQLGPAGQQGRRDLGAIGITGRMLGRAVVFGARWEGRGRLARRKAVEVGAVGGQGR